MKMSNRVYDILKYVALIFIPALNVLYCALSAIWSWPYAEQISGSVSAVNAFLGAVLGLSSAKYKKAQGSDRTKGG